MDSGKLRLGIDKRFLHRVPNCLLYLGKLSIFSGSGRSRDDDVIKNFPCIFPISWKIFYVWIRPIRYTGVTEQGYKWSLKTFCSRLRYHNTNFPEVENLRFTRTGYGDDVIDHFRKKSIIFRDTRDHQEHDTKNRLSLPGPSPEESVAEIDQLKKIWPYH